MRSGSLRWAVIISSVVDPMVSFRKSSTASKAELEGSQLLHASRSHVDSWLRDADHWLVADLPPHAGGPSATQST